MTRSANGLFHVQVGASGVEVEIQGLTANGYRDKVRLVVLTNLSAYVVDETDAWLVKRTDSGLAGAEPLCAAAAAALTSEGATAPCCAYLL